MAAGAPFIATEPLIVDLKQSLRGIGIVGERSDADTDSKWRVGRNFAETGGDAFGDLDSGGCVGVEKQNDKFVTTEARGKIAGPDGR